jgi:hypothetical protein
MWKYFWRYFPNKILYAVFVFWEPCKFQGYKNLTSLFNNNLLCDFVLDFTPKRQ